MSSLIDAASSTRNHWQCFGKKNKSGESSEGAEEKVKIKVGGDGVELKEEGEAATSGGRKWVNITKKVLLALAITGLCITGMVGVAGVVAGLMLMFIPGLGTAVGGAIAAAGGSIAAGVTAALTFLAAHSTAVLITASSVLGAAALGSAITAVIARCLCFRKKKEEGESSSISESDESDEVSRSRRGEEDEGHGLEGSHEEEGAGVKRSAEEVEGEDKSAKRTRHHRKAAEGAEGAAAEGAKKKKRRKKVKADGSGSGAPAEVAG